MSLAIGTSVPAVGYSRPRVVLIHSFTVSVSFLYAALPAGVLEYFTVVASRPAPLNGT
jgi:hypothetical protein